LQYFVDFGCLLSLVLYKKHGIRIFGTSSRNIKQRIIVHIYIGSKFTDCSIK
jgi:hypothetical protein